ncbi:COG4223 family protein [Cereibacter azotoformans]|uniref:COG4223 family protein n=1 Tax=Cereibacter azotoformans TaxID=43057 RepID=UPI000C6ED701|nr:mitofilin family membrane protein [Cereibacter azotoformans]
MSEPESREPGEKNRDDDAPDPQTLSNPEPVEAREPAEPAPAESGAEGLTTEGATAEPADRDRTLPDEAEIIAEMPPAHDREELDEPAPVPPPPPRKPEPQRSGSGPAGFVLLLVGGIAGAAGGFAYSRHAQPDWPLANYGQTDQSAAQQREIEELRAELAAASQAAPAAEPAPVAGPSQEELTAAQDRAAAAEARVAELEAQLAEAPSEQAPAADTGSLEAEIEALRQQIAEASGSAVSDAQAEAQARIAEAERAAADLKAEAESQARAATTAAALAQVEAAIDAGSPFAEPLQQLSERGVEPPAALGTHAEGGVATLDTLEDEFPAAAREALAVSRRATMGNSWTSRAQAFLLSEAGVRSLAPRAGDDPDAVLSRAEAAVRTGDLRKALEEIAALPPEGQEAMAGWTEAARTRIEAIDAVAALAAAAEGK